jgi:putative transposase
MMKLNQMFGTHREIYNKLVEISRDDCYQLSTKDLASKYRGVSQKHSIEKYLPSYHKEIPEEVMNSTYRDFTKAIKASRELFKSKIKSGERTTFPELGFKTLKDNSSSIEIQSRSFKLIGDRRIKFFQTFLGKEGIEIKEELPTMNYSVRLVRTRSKEFYLCIPRVCTFEQTTTGRACAIDPGVRDFITIYDPSGLVIGVTDGDNKLRRRCDAIDRMQAQLSVEKRKRVRARLRKTIYRTYQKIKRMIDDCHQKVSSWLASNYNEVLLPSFETSKMVKKEGRKISKRTAREMLNWSQYKFKEMLRMKMERAGGRLIECSEYYSSKTCTRCGRLNHNLGSSKIFDCPSCTHVSDRDVNAARNIYMMNEKLLTWNLRFQ